ncbi:MAG: malonyl-CoA decarboxylase N-terminal domain-containing protein, partial [Pseudomonadota bacterium]
MSRVSFLQDVLSSVFERSRIFRTEKDSRSILELCDASLSEQGEVSGSNLAANILYQFRNLDVEAKLDFFSHLAENFDLDAELVIQSAQSYLSDRSATALQALTLTAEPRRRELLRRINQTPGATELLVRMREDLLDMLADNPQLKCLDDDFEYLFSSWFNRGFL